jgi:hypothetical protein
MNVVRDRDASKATLANRHGVAAKLTFPMPLCVAVVEGVEPDKAVGV